MADSERIKKISSARKKFKELKKEKEKSVKENGHPKEKIPQVVNNRIHTKITSDETQSTSLQSENSTITNHGKTNNTNNSRSIPLFDNPIVTTNDKMVLLSDKTIIDSNEISNLNMNKDGNKIIINSEFDTITNGDTIDIKNSSSSLDSLSKSTYLLSDSISFDENNPYSNVESLRQLSVQMKALTKTDTKILDLKVRNAGMSVIVNQDQYNTEDIVSNYTDQIAQLKFDNKNNKLNLKSTEDDVDILKHQLQNLIQEVDYHIGEKCELLSNLAQCQSTATEKEGDFEELQARLKTSRSRVAELEREMCSMKNEKLNNEQSEQKLKIHELDEINKCYLNLRDEKEDIAQDFLEIQEKLKVTAYSNMQLNHQLKDLTEQLSKANLKIKQFSTGSFQDTGNVEQLRTNNLDLHNQIVELNEVVILLTKQRDESALHYERYVQQLNYQLTSLTSQLELLHNENDTLSYKEENRIKHIGDLEKQLQTLHNDQSSKENLQVTNQEEIKAELELSINLIKNLKYEIATVKNENLSATIENNVLINKLNENNKTVEQLKELVEELKTNQPNNAKLLAVMESDKVAAARAVSQNNEMKIRMDNMHEVFLKLNNDKMELTDKLAYEQRSNKNLIEKLQKTEIHLQTLADAVEMKDKELFHIRVNLLKVNQQSVNFTGELGSYTADNLMTKFPKLNHLIKERTNKSNSSIEEDASSIKLEEQKNGDNAKSLENITIGCNQTFGWYDLDKESAMKHLETKFLRTMDDLAVLTEEKYRLEHLVLQLQEETETIGEYVALYQHQRNILKQKAVEKDQQLTQLANDREYMKTKLERLNELVTKLVQEKECVPSELLEYHKTQDNDLCQRHANINSEINKIAQHSLTIKPKHSDDQHTSETAEEIIMLLSEIKSSNLIEPGDSFHHCPWCSGQLQTV